MGRFARLHAWMTCQFAWLEVPAYREFLQRGGWDFRWFRLDSYPPTDKQNYVRAFPEEQRCRGGALEIVGSVVDESAGSSGQSSTGSAGAASCARCTRTWPASRRWSSRRRAGS
jgi:phenylacetate-CoA ligase